MSGREFSSSILLSGYNTAILFGWLKVGNSLRQQFATYGSTSAVLFGSNSLRQQFSSSGSTPAIFFDSNSLRLARRQQFLSSGSTSAFPFGSNSLPPARRRQFSSTANLFVWLDVGSSLRQQFSLSGLTSAILFGSRSRSFFQRLPALVWLVSPACLSWPLFSSRSNCNCANSIWFFYMSPFF